MPKCSAFDEQTCVSSQKSASQRLKYGQKQKEKCFNLCHASARGWHSLAAHQGAPVNSVLYLTGDIPRCHNRLSPCQGKLGRRRWIFSQNSSAPGIRGRRSPSHFQKGLEGVQLQVGQAKQLFLMLKKAMKTKHSGPWVWGTDPPAGQGQACLVRRRQDIPPAAGGDYTHGMAQGHFLGWIAVGTVSAESKG